MKRNAHMRSTIYVHSLRLALCRSLRGEHPVHPRQNMTSKLFKLQFVRNSLALRRFSTLEDIGVGCMHVRPCHVVRTPFS